MLKRILLIAALVVLGSAFVTNAQSLLKNGKVPKDLAITLSMSGTIQFAPHYTYTITSDGRVFYDLQQMGLPTPNASGVKLAKLKSKDGKVTKVKYDVPKPPKLKEKLSQKQLKEIIRGFEESGFFLITDANKFDPALTETTLIDHAQTKALSIAANGKIKNVEFFMGGNYGENSPVHNFLKLYDKIRAELNTVRARTKAQSK